MDWPPASQPSVEVDLTSPKATLETMHRASLAGDLEGYVQAYDPPLQRAIRLSLVSTRELEAKAQAVAAVTERNIGLDQANVVRKLVENTIGLPFPPPSPLRRAVRAGQIDWNRVTIDVTDDKATVLVGGVVLPITLKLVGGKWYAAPPAGASMTPQRFADETVKAVAIIRRLAQNLGDLEQGVRSGQVDKYNFQQEFNRAVFSSGPSGG